MRLQVCKKQVLLYGGFKQPQFGKWRFLGRGMIRRTRNRIIVEAKRKKKIKVRELGPDEGFDMSMVEYLKFGQLVGDTPEEVILNLEEKGYQTNIDKKTKEFYQEWDEAERADYQFHKSLAEYEDTASYASKPSFPGSDKKLQTAQNFASSDAGELSGYHQEEFAVREKRLQTRSQALQKLNSRREYLNKWSPVTTTSTWSDVLPESIDVEQPVGRDLVELSEKAGELSNIVSVGVDHHSVQDQDYDYLFDDEDDENNDLSYEEFEKLLKQEQEDDNPFGIQTLSFPGGRREMIKVPELVRPNRSPDGSPQTIVVKPEALKKPSIRLVPPQPKVEPKPIKPKLLQKPSRGIEEDELEEQEEYEEELLSDFEKDLIKRAALEEQIQSKLSAQDYQGLLSKQTSKNKQASKSKKTLLKLQRPTFEKQEEEIEEEIEEEDEQISLSKDDYLDIRLTAKDTPSLKKQLIKEIDTKIDLVKKPQRQIRENQQKEQNLEETEDVIEQSKQDLTNVSSQKQKVNQKQVTKSKLNLIQKPQRKEDPEDQEKDKEEEELEKQEIQLNKEDYLDIRLSSENKNFNKLSGVQVEKKEDKIRDKFVRPELKEPKKEDLDQQKKESVNNEKIGSQQFSNEQNLSIKEDVITSNPPSFSTTKQQNQKTTNEDKKIDKKQDTEQNLQKDAKNVYQQKEKQPAMGTAKPVKALQRLSNKLRDNSGTEENQKTEKQSLAKQFSQVLKRPQKISKKDDENQDKKIPTEKILNNEEMEKKEVAMVTSQNSSDDNKTQISKKFSKPELSIKNTEKNIQSKKNQSMQQSKHPSSNIFSLKPKKRLSEATFGGDNDIIADQKIEQDSYYPKKQQIKQKYPIQKPDVSSIPKTLLSPEELDKRTELAKKLQEDRTVFNIEIVRSNKSGFICTTDVGLDMVFMHVRNASPERVEKVMQTWAQLGQNELNNKYVAIGQFVGVKTKACVSEVSELGSVYISERLAYGQLRSWSQEDLAFLEQCIGMEVEAVIVGIPTFGLIVRFEIEKDGQKVEGTGIIHQSEITWETNEASLSEFKLDQKVRASLVVVDPSKNHVNLSIRQLEDNPVMQSLDLLKSKIDEDEVEKDIDSEEELEDMPVVQQLTEQLTNQPGVIGVEAKMRVKGRASAQELQVFMSKDVADNQGGLFGYSLLVRLGLDVQEIVVTASLERHEFKNLLALVVEEIKDN